jgi:hypothetical protein
MLATSSEESVLEKLLVSQLINKSPNSTEPETLSPCLQIPQILTVLRHVIPVHAIPSYFFKPNINIILSPTPVSYTCSFQLVHLHENRVAVLFSAIRSTCPAHQYHTSREAPHSTVAVHSQSPADPSHRHSQLRPLSLAVSTFHLTTQSHRHTMQLLNSQTAVPIGTLSVLTVPHRSSALPIFPTRCNI